MCERCEKEGYRRAGESICTPCQRECAEWSPEKPECDRCGAGGPKVIAYSGELLCYRCSGCEPTMEEILWALSQ